MNTYEADLRQALKVELDAGYLREVGKAAEIFDLLAKVYPVSGSKIDWKRVPGAIETTEEDHSLQADRFAEFFEEMRSRFRLADPVLYAGDSATDFALEGSMDAMQRALTDLIDVPQHHYFVGPNGSWCICMTMEGDMAFGQSAFRAHH